MRYIRRGIMIMRWRRFGNAEESRSHRVMDVRAFTNSKKHPQYNQTALREWLEAHGVDVKHIVVNHQDKIEIVPHELGQWGAMPII